VVLLADEDSRLAGFFLAAVVLSTDWVDGLIARRTGQVTELGKLLDPLADRLAMAATLITLAVTELIPWWVAGVVLVRDAVVLVAALALAATGGPRIDVRPIGKYATFTLMWGVPAIAWGNAGLAFDDVFIVFGWVWFVVGSVEYYAAAVAYALDLRREYRARRA
jgi:cardiolipin synthase (CMP-forming)